MNLVGQPTQSVYIVSLVRITNNYTLGKDRDEVPRLQQKRKKTKRKARATYSMMIREKRPSKGGSRRGVKPARLGLKNVGIPPPQVLKMFFF